MLSVSGTYDTRKASWYESMAIMPTMFDPGGTGPDPFAVDVDVEGEVTHGHLPENDGHGGSRLTGLPDPRDLLARPVGGSGKVAIKGFVYGQGDLSNVGRRAAPRACAAAAGSRSSTATPGRRSSTRSPRARRPATARRASPTRWPTARSTSTRASSASARKGFTPAANRDTWTTPKRLDPGTYTYFCRVHPFMRGAFKVARQRR